MNCLLLTTELNRAALVVIENLDVFRRFFVVHFDALFLGGVNKLFDIDAPWIPGEKSGLNEI